MSQRKGKRGSFSVRRLRAVILMALFAGVGGFTGIILELVSGLSDRFGPQVRADLEWRALRGASELASSADLGIALDDRAMVMDAFAPYISSSDILEMVAVNAEGKVIAQHGSDPPLASLFAARPGAVVEGPGYLTSWQPVQIEGGPIGKVAVVVSTARLTDTRATLATVSATTMIAGAIGLLCGVMVIFYFTRAVVTRDLQLNEYAATLERRVEDRTRELDERNRGMRLVLDNVAQGFITIDRRGVMDAERSAIVDEWFGPPSNVPPTFADQVRELAPDFAAWFELSLEMLRDGVLPVEVCLGQLPRRFEAHGRTFDVSYSPILDDAEQLERVLVILSDVTQQLARERAERDQREMLTVFQRIVADRTSCEEFLAETSALLDGLRLPGERAIELRALHTLKGNCAMFGFETFAELCHELENELVELAPAPLSEEQRARLMAGGERMRRTMTSLLGGHVRDVIEIERPELISALELARHGASSEELAALLTTWSYEPVAHRFERFGQQARSLARRLGKGEVNVTISDGGIRLDPIHWAPLWTAMVHAIRNAIDHGLEDPSERERLGKGPPHLTFTATRTEQQLILSIADDGKGIDWEALRSRVGGLHHGGRDDRRADPRADGRSDLIALMFQDGFSTRAEATETSGRGVGLAALQAVVGSLGGRIEVESQPGAGTRFELQFPLERRASFMALRSGRPSAGATAR
jgi:signal transduction histidine kinase